MPLKKGEKNIGANIKELQSTGRSHAQAVAIAMRVAGHPVKRAMRRLLLWLLLCLLLPLPAWAVTDNFAGTAGTNLGTYSANWTVFTNAADIQINTTGDGASAAGSTSAPNAVWNATSPSNDQFAQATLTFLAFSASNAGLGVCVRCDASGNGYWGIFYPANNTAYILNMAAGSLTSIVATDNTTWVSGDVIRLEVSGTALTLKRNGSVAASGTDGTYTSGHYGIAYFAEPETGTPGSVGTWSAGDLGGGGGATKSTLGLLGVGH